MEPSATFGQVWRDKVRELTATSGAILNPDNSEWKRRFTGSKAKFAAQGPAFSELAARLVASLLDDAAPAGAAKDLLIALRQLITEPGADYTNFPSSISNCLLEYINAKALWQCQITWPLPGPGIDGAGKEPDYRVSGLGVNQACGDHIRAQAPKNAQEMTRAITAALNEKLTTYRQPQVRVIIDASDALATGAIGNTADDRPAWAVLVSEAIAGVPQLDRLFEFDIVARPAVVFQFVKGADYLKPFSL